MSTSESLDDDRFDVGLLHISVRFYKDLWAITLPVMRTAESSPSAASLETDKEKVLASLTLLRLHQTLLPPAPVNGLGDIADESYAVQLATDDGFDFLIDHWDVLLPLLFPCAHVRGLQLTCPASPLSWEAEQHNEERKMEGAENSWSTLRVISAAQQPLKTADVKAMRNPGFMDRLYYSYIVILRFFGWRVHDEKRGLLDRHRGWLQRYNQLSPFSHGLVQPKARSTTLLSPSAQSYQTDAFYSSALPRVLQCLLDVGFLTLGVRLVEFLLEELSCGRLGFLQPLVEEQLLRRVVEDVNVDESHKNRLKKRLRRLQCSDSD